MKVFLIFGIIAVVAVIMYRFSLSQPPLAGMLVDANGQMVLASRAKPALQFMVAAEQEFLQSGYKTVRPGDRRGDNESVRFLFAAYKGKKNQLITALAETPAGWTWVAGHHVPYKTLRDREEVFGKETMYTSVFVLHAKQDPFTMGEGTVLCARAKLLLKFRTLQVIVEYREPIEDAVASTLDLNPDYLRAFVERAHTFFDIQLVEDTSSLQDLEKLQAAENVSRVLLSQWLGEVRHPGQNR